MTSKEIIKELRKEIDKILQTGKSLRSYRIYQYLDMLEKDNPTLSECIKEWEDRGWTSFKSKSFGWFIVEKDCKKIIFDWNEINYSCAKEFDIDLELHNLINKTLKALEVEDES